MNLYFTYALPALAAGIFVASVRWREYGSAQQVGQFLCALAIGSPSMVLMSPWASSLWCAAGVVLGLLLSVIDWASWASGHRIGKPQRAAVIKIRVQDEREKHRLQGPRRQGHGGKRL